MGMTSTLRDPKPLLGWLFAHPTPNEQLVQMAAARRGDGDAFVGALDAAARRAATDETEPEWVRHAAQVYVAILDWYDQGSQGDCVVDLSPASIPLTPSVGSAGGGIF